MYSAIAAFILALATAVITTPAVRSWARQLGAVDAPDTRRVNQRAIPRLGGVAVIVAFFVPLFLLVILETDTALIFFDNPQRIIGLGLGGLLVCGLGAVDDIRGVRAWTKLIVQCGAAAIAYACGYRVEAVAVPFIGVLDMGVFSLPFTMLWIVGVINAVNLIDGLDGLAAGIAFFACVTNFVVGLLTGNALVMLLSAALGGGIVGFLLYNFNPATIFMGDSGSMFLGYVLATTSLLGAAIKSSTTVALLIPLIAMGVPIADMLLAMVRRILERRHIFSPDRGHIHHRLLDLGLTHRRAVLLLYGFSILCCGSAIAVAGGRSWEVGGALVLMSVVTIGMFQALRYSEQLRAVRRPGMRGHPPNTERLRQVVPRLLREINQVRTPEEFRLQLEAFAGIAGLCELQCRTDDEVLVDWSESTALCASGRDDTYQVTAEYTLQRAQDTIVRFVWKDGYSGLSPRDDMLLQLVADACETVLAERDWLLQTEATMVRTLRPSWNPEPAPEAEEAFKAWKRGSLV